MTSWGGDQTPAGARADADSAAPAGTSGADFLAAYRKALAARGKARRRGAGRYVRQADRTAGDQYRAGRARRPPPEPEPDGGDAA